MTENQNKEVKSIFQCWSEAIRQYFKIDGRTTRYEYWAFMTVTIVLLGIWLLFIRLFDLNHIFMEVILLYILIPTTTISIRRLHDFNSGAGWVVPALGLAVLTLLNWEYDFLNSGITLFLLLCYVSYLFWMLAYRGDQYANRYGFPVIEPKIYNEDSQVFIGFSTLILVIFWLVFLFTL